MKSLNQIREFALAAHGDQRYGHHPYSFHLDGVFDKVSEYSQDNSVLGAAYLHDTDEDTSETCETILQFLGADGASHHTVKIVDLLTDRPGRNRLERHLNTYHRIRQDRDAVLVKMGDRWKNQDFSLSQIPTEGPRKAAMYAKEYLNFKFALYVPGQHQDFWAELDAQVEKINNAIRSA